MTIGYPRAVTDIQPYSKQLDYDGSGNVIYYGEALAGTPTSAPYWRIKKLTYSGGGNLLSMLYAGGIRNFSNAWDNRAALSYS